MFLIEDYLYRYKSKSVRYNVDDDLICNLPCREMQQLGFLKIVYGELNLNPTIRTSSHGTDTPTGSIYLPVAESVLKRIIRTYFEKGFWAALDEARKELTLVDKLLYSYKYLKVKLCLSSPEIEPEDITRYVETRDWLVSIIRYIAWHPKCNKFAVASFDDSVRIFALPLCTTLFLDIMSQKHITCMAWRPICGNEIAIGCDKGMVIWTIENQQVPMYEFVSHPKGLPIVSMQWNKNGTLLATASIADPEIMLWVADTLKWIPLKRYGSPITKIKWAPDSEWLFSGTTDSTFCIWDCDNLWKQESWNLISGSMQSACWSPCGTYLVFVTTTDSFLYRLEIETIKYKMFKKYDHGKDIKFSTIADLKQHTVGSTIIGGMPQQLAWNCDGRFLCITFKDSDCIVVFHTYLQLGRFQISAAFYIEENNLNVFPSIICFQGKHRDNNKIVLTIGWSSGLIQHCQLE